MIRSAFASKCAPGVSRRTPSYRPAFLKRTNKPLRLTRRSPLPLPAKKRTDDKVTAPLTEAAVEEIENQATVEEEAVSPPAPERRYYEAYPASPPPFPVHPPQYVSEPSNGLPPWVWIMVGVLLATVFTKVMNFVSRPKEAMAEMMMKQMMNQMGSQKGASPFGGAMPQGSPFGMPPTAPAYDTTAKPFTPPPPPPTQPPPVSPFGPAGLKPETDAQQNGVQTSPVAEKQTVADPTPPPSSSGFFQDVTAEQQAAVPMREEDTDEAVDFMFEMLKNPQMRESLYQFLPENMRSPEMLETVMASPMVKEQFKSMMTPELLQQLKGFQGQMGTADVKNQLESMNVSPDVLMQKLMNEPEIVAMMQKPNVMQAVMDLQQNPGNMSKYMNDPEVMQFMMKMNELTLQAQMQGQETPLQPPEQSAGAPSTAVPTVPQEPAPAASPTSSEKSS